MSTPHFIDGEEEYINQSIGLRPNQDLHRTYLDVEPVYRNIKSHSHRID